MDEIILVVGRKNDLMPNIMNISSDISELQKFVGEKIQINPYLDEFVTISNNGDMKGNYIVAKTFENNLISMSKPEALNIITDLGGNIKYL